MVTFHANETQNDVRVEINSIKNDIKQTVPLSRVSLVQASNIETGDVLFFVITDTSNSEATQISERDYWWLRGLIQLTYGIVRNGDES